jgi:putative membrane protein
MNRFFIRLIINAIALYIAIRIVPGIELQSGAMPLWLTIALLALVFGVLNALLRPLITLLTCPLIILTLGLGTLLINTFLFYLTGWIGAQLGWGFTVDGFWPAFLGALVVSVVSVVLSLVFRDEGKQRRRSQSWN